MYVMTSMVLPYVLLTISQTTNFRLFQTERVCGQQFQIVIKMAESYPKWEENTEGKREIARYEQFLLFPQCFQKICTAEM